MPDNQINSAKISVIIPCYNVEKYIAKCIQSVANQHYTNLEIICINDGSEDNTEQIIMDLIESSNLPIMLINQKNNGACSARNKGIERSTGDYIQFLDADDILLENKLLSQVKLIQKNEMDIVIGSYRRQDESGNISFEKIYDRQDIDVWISLMRTDLGITSSNLFNARLFDHGIQWNTKLQSSQEYDLMFQILQMSQKLIFDKNINTLIITRDFGSISQTNIKEKWYRYIDLRIRIIDFLKEKHIEINWDQAYQILFDSIRTLYKYDAKKSVEYFKHSIPTAFKPSISLATSKKYLVLYNLLGYKKTQHLLKLLKK